MGPEANARTCVQATLVVIPPICYAAAAIPSTPSLQSTDALDRIPAADTI